MTREQALDALKKYGSKTRAAAELRVCHKTITKALGGAPQQSAPVKPAGRPLADFRSQYDKSYIVPNRIKAALSQLGSGWEYEVQFAKLAGVSLSDLGAYRDQFAAHIVVLGRDGRRAWAGTRTIADAMRSML
jgi:hypothetical protein